MEDQLITFKTAKLAKEKGFNGSCLCSYNEVQGLEHCINYTGELYFTQEYIDIAKENGKISYLAPTQSLLQKWLREKHNMDVLIIKSKHECYDVFVWGETRELFFPEDYAKTYEEALEKGLQEALKLIK